ncbi:nicalin-1-like [Danio aesculapii]|uniref:nicalin-1-like n=1 Tax=Danio aesculapii TaxID=1142201 RepID=UPI0024BF7A75|nr:nicalin-1-like [Danio aesculapii]
MVHRAYLRPSLSLVPAMLWTSHPIQSTRLSVLHTRTIYRGLYVCCWSVCWTQMCVVKMTVRSSTVAALLLLSVHLLHASALPAASSYEFNAYRMQHYNLHQHKHGCRGAIVVAEARSAADTSLTRRCVIMKLHDFTTERFLEAKKQNAAAVLILLPQNLSSVQEETVQGFMVAEAQILQEETILPVYVVPEDEQLLCMYEEVNQAVASKSASVLVRVLRSMITSTAFQILVSNNSPIKPITDTSIITLEGVLPGAGEDPPTIVITAHYDTFGLAPWLAYGADSNGSGVAILLELVRLFHRLYCNPRSQAPYHLLFSLTGGGKYNFLGTKHWLEENMDHAESSLLHDNVEFVICLDSLGTGDEIFLHVSRPPKPGTPQYSFIQQLEQIISARFPWVRFGTVHKKINLQETNVAWEHERYGMKRIPGFTLSHIENPKSELRGSILDSIAQVDMRKLKRNTVIVAESLARFIYNLSDKGSAKDMQVFKGSLDIQDSRLSALMTMLTTVPRAVQLLDREPEHTLLINSLEQEFKHYLKQVHKHTFHQDRRDPEITFFDQMKQPMMMYRVKPAAFDLFLGGCIAGYLGIVYYGIQNFGKVYTKLKATMKAKHQ